MDFLVLKVQEKISAKNNPYKLVTYKEQDSKNNKTAFYYGTKDIKSNTVYSLRIESKGYGDVINSIEIGTTPIEMFTQTYCSEQDFLYYVENIKIWIEQLEEPYKSITKEFYTKYGLYDDKPTLHPYLTNTAAIVHHHAGKYGLIAHIFEVAFNAVNLLNIYAKANPDKSLVLAGALLHDIGKFETYGINTDGIPSVTEIGNYINHLPYGLAVLSTSTYRDKYPLEITKLMEIVQSHHSRIEFGSVDLPKSIESIIVAQADLTSYYVEAYVQGIEDTSQRTISISDMKIINPNFKEL